LWDPVPVSKEEAKKLGMEVRSTATGPKHVRVELEFKPEDKLKHFSQVDLQLDQGDNPTLTAALREDRSKPGRVAVSFTADTAQLDKLTLRVMVPFRAGGAGGTIYVIRLKEFVELKTVDMPPNKALQQTAAAILVPRDFAAHSAPPLLSVAFAGETYLGTNRMKSIGTAWFKGCTSELDAAAIRREVERFARLLSVTGLKDVRVWCSYNPDLPDDSPLQSPERIVPPEGVTAFFDEAVRNGVWTYGDVWNRAGVDASSWRSTRTQVSATPPKAATLPAAEVRRRESPRPSPAPGRQASADEP
jgi:hypothetical protein